MVSVPVELDFLNKPPYVDCQLILLPALATVSVYPSTVDPLVGTAE